MSLKLSGTGTMTDWPVKSDKLADTPCGSRYSRAFPKRDYCIPSFAWGLLETDH